MNDDFDMDMETDVSEEMTTEARLASIQKLIHELSYSIRTQREQITMISKQSQNSTASLR